MELRQLKYFQAIAEFKSLTRASAHLGVTQPALTRQLGILEKELGLELLVRHSRGVNLTDAGATLLRRADRLMLELRQLREEMAGVGDVVNGPLRIGVSAGAADLLLPAVVATLVRLYPRLELSITEGEASALQKSLLGDELDIAITHPLPRTMEINCIPLLSETIELISSPEESAPRGSINCRDAVELPLIAPGRPNILRDLLSDVLGKMGLDFHPVVEVNGIVAAKALLATGKYHSILTRNVLRGPVRRGELVATKIVDMPCHYSVAVMARKSRQAGRIINSFVEVAREEAALLVKKDLWAGELL